LNLKTARHAKAIVHRVATALPVVIAAHAVTTLAKPR
jgi:hypothetical protein